VDVDLRVHVEGREGATAAGGPRGVDGGETCSDDRLLGHLPRLRVREPEGGHVHRYLEGEHPRPEAAVGVVDCAAGLLPLEFLIAEDPRGEGGDHEVLEGSRDMSVGAEEISSHGIRGVIQCQC